MRPKYKTHYVCVPQGLKAHLRNRKVITIRFKPPNTIFPLMTAMALKKGGLAYKCKNVYNPFILKSPQNGTKIIHLSL